MDNPLKKNVMIFTTSTHITAEKVCIKLITEKQEYLDEINGNQEENINYIQRLVVRM
jgi:hypothetical protein